MLAYLWRGPNGEINRLSDRLIKRPKFFRNVKIKIPRKLGYLQQGRTCSRRTVTSALVAITPTILFAIRMFVAARCFVSRTARLVTGGFFSPYLFLLRSVTTCQALICREYKCRNKNHQDVAYIFHLNITLYRWSMFPLFTILLKKILSRQQTTSLSG